MNDELGKRMKEYYEERTRNFLPRRTYTIIRLDGKAFHTYTQGMRKPFDSTLISAMQQTTLGLCEKIQGVKFGYVQSDEISLLLTDFDTIRTDAWYNGNVQKIVSVSASIATMEFNTAATKTDGYLNPTALFDSRVFTIPERVEVENYFIWRNQDCARNSINAVAQSMFSHKQLQKKSCSAVHEMLMTEKGVNWSNDYTEVEKNGSVICRVDGQWTVIPAWKFAANREKLSALIPCYE